MLNPCSPTLKHKGCRQEVIEKRQPLPAGPSFGRFMEGMAKDLIPTQGGPGNGILSA